jgi:nucleoside-diphosphate-sugar epimerase
MRCVIIGGTRVIGPHVVQRLHARGWDIAVLHRGVHRAVLPEGVLQITDESAGIPVLRVPRAAQRFAPDVVLHMIAMGERDVLRLPKVYGPVENADLATVYRFRRQPHWRWTHGYVENVAEAIALAVVNPRAANNVFNVGEAHTPTIAERLARLPDRQATVADEAGRNFDQDIAYDTSKIRRELGFVETIDEVRAMTACVLGST